MAKCIIAIAALLKSTRLPKKVLAQVEDQTVLEHIIDRVRQSKIADDFVVCTSTNSRDDPIVEVAKKKNIKIFRGSEDDVLDRFIKCAEQEDADILVRVTGDNIFTDHIYIDYQLEHHKNTNADYTVVEGLPKGVKAESMSLSAMKKAHELAENPDMSEYMTLYFKNSGFFNDIKLSVKDSVKRPEYRLTIDYPEDLELVKQIFKNLYKPGKIFTLQEIIRFLDEHKSMLDINSSVDSRNVRMEVVEINGKKKMKIVVE